VTGGIVLAALLAGLLMLTAFLVARSDAGATELVTGSGDFSFSFDLIFLVMIDLFRVITD
jgi:hypothetical protein